MNTALKLASYGAALVLVAGGAWVTGAVAGPVTEPPPATHEDESGGGGGHGDDGGGEGGHDSGGGEVTATGLAASEKGYTFAPTDTTVSVGKEQSFSFRILGPDGKAVRKFDVEHEKRLHLIVVRRDTTGFQHIHPELAADGTWRVPLRLAEGGSYRAFADFKPTGGPALTLGTDLSAPGDYQPVHQEASRTSTVDGYQVRLDGDLEAGTASDLTLSVSKDGEPVTDLQPYLGAYGHLVALRTSDLAYLHVHPEGEPGDGKTKAGPTVTFAAEVPSDGDYRLFLDFKHDGKVRTADFTVTTHGHEEEGGS